MTRLDKIAEILLEGLRRSQAKNAPAAAPSGPRVSSTSAQANDAGESATDAEAVATTRRTA